MYRSDSVYGHRNNRRQCCHRHDGWWKELAGSVHALQLIEEPATVVVITWDMNKARPSDVPSASATVPDVQESLQGNCALSRTLGSWTPTKGVLR